MEEYKECCRNDERGVNGKLIKKMLMLMKEKDNEDGRGRRRGQWEIMQVNK